MVFQGFTNPYGESRKRMGWWGIHPSLVGQDNRRFNLPFRDTPILPEKSIFLSFRHDSISVLLVKRYGPDCSSPRSDQNGFAVNRFQVSQKMSPDALLLCAGPDVTEMKFHTWIR